MNDNVNFQASAELFPAPSHRRGPLRYHRFDTLAEAVRYAMEELSPQQLTGAFIEAEEVRSPSPHEAGLLTVVART